MRALLPDSRFRSPTAVDDRADMRDDNIFSSVVVADGGSGQIKAFTVPQGQTIPALKGSAITIAPAHQLVHSELTTNFSKAGEAGSAIGDFSIRAISATLENAFYDSSGVQNTYGAGQQEINEVLSKTFFQLKIAGKKQIEGPVWMFPSSGGAYGSIASTENAVTVAALTNGLPGTMRRLKIPILAARTDTIEGVVGLGGSGTVYDFTTATGTGNSSLLWFNLHATVKGDVR